MILYCNSDSYGVMSTTKNRYSDFLGEALGASITINNGKSGSCNRRIVRTTLRDLTDIKDTNPLEEILAVICLGSLIRTEWWDEDYKPKPNETDGHFQSLQIHKLNNNKNKPSSNYLKEWFKLFNDEAEQTNLLVDLVLLTTWFKSNDINYIIFAGSNVTYKKNDYSDIFIESFSKKIFNDPHILNINTFSFVQYCLERKHVPFDYDQYQNNGHHGEKAHKDFAEFLLNFYNTTIKKT
jgi:hypothetical protein